MTAAQTQRWISLLSVYLPGWLISLAILAAAALLAFFFHRTFMRTVRRLIGSERVFIQSLLSRILGATRFAFVLAAVAIVLPIVPLSNETAVPIAQVLAVCLTLLSGWAALVAIDLAGDFYLRRFKIDVDDNFLARKHVTQVRVLRRVADTIVVMITVAVALMTFPAVRQFGISLIASAGAAGLVVGLAARPVLTNLIAGVQIAITQPIRIGDAVVVENEWGWIEEISGTYVVIQIWDWRRLVVPLSYFLEKPFQNWTRTSSQIIGTTMLWVDYTTPVEDVRAELSTIVKSSKLWDGRVVNLQVTKATEHAIQLRALASARTSQQVWDLRCEIREKLICFLQEHHPGALPKHRTELRSPDGSTVDFESMSAGAHGRPGAPEAM
ncbi:mechanosensitive ion channel family protein [Methylovirgula sp. HY1]|uniref:mechanosensitive ion channel family protein n=1 Tax=Methylovirgula sp. HY1 TaxID=2822761 RepID=UPI001C5AC1B0|nr:mechanosensitive ion channel family protein [Methylovirgula sp. HY1]QXX73713.1 Miniconductance mechanosensitive channel MscM [Methylovirgula sp. HY1]